MTDGYLEYPITMTGSSRDTNDHTASGELKRTSPVDQSTVLLVLSCHHRLVRIWSLVTAHATELVKHGIFKSPDWPAKRACTSIKIGSFTPSSDSTLNSALMPVISDLFLSLEQSLQRLIESIQIDSGGQNHSIENNQRNTDSMVDLDFFADDASSLNSLIPACNTALNLSRKLIQSSDECRVLFLEAGLLR
jgi:hypothetical protein